MLIGYLVVYSAVQCRVLDWREQIVCKELWQRRRVWNTDTKTDKGGYKGQTLRIVRILGEWKKRRKKKGKGARRDVRTRKLRYRRMSWISKVEVLISVFICIGAWMNLFKFMCVSTSSCVLTNLGLRFPGALHSFFEVSQLLPMTLFKQWRVTLHAHYITYGRWRKSCHVQAFYEVDNGKMMVKYGKEWKEKNSVMIKVT